MTLKKFACRFVASCLLIGGITVVLPAENIQLAPTVQAAGQNSYAIDSYTKEIQQNPKDAKAYFNRGLMYCGEQDDKAVADFSMVIKLEPNNIRGYLHRGIAYRNLGKYDKAVKDFDKVISMEPQNALNYINRGLAYYYAKNYDKARADYNHALKNDTPYDSSLEKNLANQGIKINLNPHNAAQAYYGLGLIDYDEKNYKAALENFNKALKDAENYLIYESRAECYKMLGDNAKAKADLKKAEELRRAEKAMIDSIEDSVMSNIEAEIEDDD